MLRTGLDGLKENSAVGGFGPGPVPTISKTRGTIIYDAVYLAADEKLKARSGAKAIVLITDGVDMGSGRPCAKLSMRRIERTLSSTAFSTSITSAYVRRIRTGRRRRPEEDVGRDRRPHVHA